MPKLTPSSLLSLLQLNFTTSALLPSSWLKSANKGTISLQGPHLQQREVPHQMQIFCLCRVVKVGMYNERKTRDTRMLQLSKPNTHQSV